MCSWCYGFSRTLKELLEALPDSIEVKRLLGGLAPDNDEPMSDDMKVQVHSNWHRIEQSIPAVTFNHDFWTTCVPRRSTYPACRAVIAARAQGDEFDVLMTESIQQAYYQHARNPSDVATLIELADELALDVGRFRNTIASAQTQSILQQEIKLSAEIGASSFPALKLQTEGAFWPISVDYNSPEPMLDLIDSLLD